MRWKKQFEVLVYSDGCPSAEIEAILWWIADGKNQQCNSFLNRNLSFHCFICLSTILLWKFELHILIFTIPIRLEGTSRHLIVQLRETLSRIDWNV